MCGCPLCMKDSYLVVFCQKVKWLSFFKRGLSLFFPAGVLPVSRAQRWRRYKKERQMQDSGGPQEHVRCFSHENFCNGWRESKRRKQEEEWRKAPNVKRALEELSQQVWDVWHQTRCAWGDDSVAEFLLCPSAAMKCIKSNIACQVFTAHNVNM